VNALLGLPQPLPELRSGVLAAPVARNAHREEYVRGVVHRDGVAIVVEPLAGRESHLIVSAGRADALVQVEAGTGELAAGDAIRYIPLG
jgi:molybdopterin biosynthesis enzyme